MAKAKKITRTHKAHKFGRVIWRERSHVSRPFELLRLADIEKIIRHRHGRTIPETDLEDNAFWFTAGHAIDCYYDQEIDRLQVLTEWLQKWAPWMEAPAIAAKETLAKCHPRRLNMRARKAAEILNVGYDEQQALGLRTISCNDKSTAELKALRKARKSERDRERRAAERRAKGARPRSESLSQAKPWEAEGISRRTWERRRRANDANSSPLSHEPETHIDANSSPLSETADYERDANSSRIREYIPTSDAIASASGGTSHSHLPAMSAGGLQAARRDASSGVRTKGIQLCLFDLLEDCDAA